MVPALNIAQAQTKAPPTVRASLSQANVIFGDSVALTVSAINLDAAIDLSPLERDFNVTGQSSSREVRVFNGAETTLVNWVVQPPTGGQRVLFVEAFVDEAAPYVQSQVLLTVKVWRAVEVLDSALENLGSDDFITLALDTDKQYVAERDGREYVVHEQNFSLFPQSSGVLTFGPIELRAKVEVNRSRSQGLFRPTQLLKRRSKPVTLNVKPRPSSTRGQWWLPAKNVVLKESWSTDVTAIDAGDTITRTIELIAQGVAAKQLPTIDVPNVDGLKLYADAANQSTTNGDQGLVSTHEVTWAVVPERNGDIEVPAIQVNWFDTESGTPQVAELPARTLSVSGLAENESVAVPGCNA